MSVTIKWRKLPDIISSMTMEEYVKRKKTKIPREREWAIIEV